MLKSDTYHNRSNYIRKIQKLSLEKNILCAKRSYLQRIHFLESEFSLTSPLKMKTIRLNQTEKKTRTFLLHQFFTPIQWYRYLEWKLWKNRKNTERRESWLSGKFAQQQHTHTLSTNTFTDLHGNNAATRRTQFVHAYKKWFSHEREKVLTDIVRKPHYRWAGNDQWVTWHLIVVITIEVKNDKKEWWKMTRN